MHSTQRQCRVEPLHVKVIFVVMHDFYALNPKLEQIDSVVRAGPALNPA